MSEGSEMAELAQDNESKLHEDTLVQKLVGYPGGGSQSRVEIGFLGRSPREGYWCLYTGPDLTDYLEFQEKDVLHGQSLETRENPLGGTMVWISSDATVRAVRVGPQRSQSDFLQGPVMEQFLGSTGIAGLTVGGPYGIWTIFTSTPCAVATIVIVVYSAVKCKATD